MKNSTWKDWQHFLQPPGSIVVNHLTIIFLGHTRTNEWTSPSHDITFASREYVIGLLRAAAARRTTPLVKSKIKVSSSSSWLLFTMLLCENVCLRNRLSTKKMCWERSGEKLDLLSRWLITSGDLVGAIVDFDTSGMWKAPQRFRNNRISDELLIVEMSSFIYSSSLTFIRWTFQLACSFNQGFCPLTHIESCWLKANGAA